MPSHWSIFSKKLTPPPAPYPSSKISDSGLGRPLRLPIFERMHPHIEKDSGYESLIHTNIQSFTRVSVAGTFDGGGDTKFEFSTHFST